MKKVTDFIKPNILIIFGALLFLYFLNYLSLGGSGLAIGIIAVVISAYYLTIGILGVIIGDKFTSQLKKIFEVISVSLFGVFMFTYFLLTTINGAQINGLMGPTAWTIEILSMIACLALVAIYIVAKFTNKDVMMRFAYLFSAIFALALLLDILFDVSGNSTVLGNLDILLVAIYAVFVFYLFSSFEKPEQATEQPSEEKNSEEAQPEEEPKQEE